MKTLREVLSLATQYLQDRQISSSRRESEDLLCDVLNITRIGLYSDLDRPMVEAELAICRARLARRARREPLAYIHGEVEFADCRIKVNPGVLIPRQETEILVDRIVQSIAKDQDLCNASFWDVCCGSGCIGIALKKHCSQLSVELSDLSEKAVETTRLNAQFNEVEVAVHQGDLLAPFSGRQCRYFVCNPPYVSEKEFIQLEPEVRDFEPKSALVADQNGYAFYERLAKELPHHLVPGGKAWFEIGQGMGAKLLELFPAHVWKERRVEMDWAGHERFFFLENE